MLALNLPGFAPKVAEKDGKRMIFDPVRQKYVALTPEEWVRQHFVNYLITRKSYPKELAIRLLTTVFLNLWSLSSTKLPI